MIQLVCPNCGRTLDIFRLMSQGWCGCGLDWRLDLDKNQAVWTHDPKYASSGTKDYTTEIPRETQ